MNKILMFYLVPCPFFLSLISICSPLDFEKIGPQDYENIPSSEFWPTERRRELNKHYSKNYVQVTDRFTLGIGVNTIGICRCWKSKSFPYCDNSHKLHNKFHKDNVGPLIIDSPTFPDHFLDRYTQKTPDRSITYPTEATPSDSEADRNMEEYNKKHEYPDSSDQNETSRIDKNDLFERLRNYPPGMRPRTAPFGFC